jgi:hypothetical protein
MKHLVGSLVLLFAVMLIFPGCKKNSNNYSVTDHTVGMNKVRTWTGYSNGYYYGDTSWAGKDITWPKWYMYTTTDSPCAVLPVNGFVVNVMGRILNWRSTDSVLKIVVFDSIYANSQRSFLIWDYGQDTMRLEFHRMMGWNDTLKLYYQDNKYLHGNHP